LPADDAVVRLAGTNPEDGVTGRCYAEGGPDGGTRIRAFKNLRGSDMAGTGQQSAADGGGVFEALVVIGNDDGVSA